MTRITDLTEATTLAGTEFAEISSLSTTVTITATTISALASDNSYNDSGSGFVAAGFAIGDRVKVTGFTGDAANNIFAATVTAVTAGKLTIGGTDGDVIVDDAAGESVTITKWESKRSLVTAFGSPAPIAQYDMTSRDMDSGNGIVVDLTGYYSARIVCSGLTFSSTDYLSMRVSTDGGTTKVSTSTYLTRYDGALAGGGTTTSYTLGIPTGQAHSSITNIHNLGVAAPTVINTTYNNTTGAIFFSGSQTTENVNGIHIFSNGGNDPTVGDLLIYAQ